MLGFLKIFFDKFKISKFRDSIVIARLICYILSYSSVNLLENSVSGEPSNVTCITPENAGRGVGKIYPRGKRFKHSYKIYLRKIMLSKIFNSLV